MEKASWVKEQLAAWGFRGVTVISTLDRILYIRREAAETLTNKQMEYLKIRPTSEDNMFDNLRLQNVKQAMIAFKY